MGFDYVLAHRERQYLAMETEKLDYFSGTLGIDRSYLPGRIYRSKDGQIKTARYFLDKFPLFLSGAPGAAPPVVCFATSTGRLESHRASTLPCCRTQICSLGWIGSGLCTSRRTSPCLLAERDFLAPVRGSGRGANGLLLDPEVRRLLHHFHKRDLLERRQRPRSTSTDWTGSAMS